MSRLDLHFTDTLLQILTQNNESIEQQLIVIEKDKPFARERMAGPINEALHHATLKNCLWFDPDFTLFPRDLFDQNQIASYYTLNHGSVPVEKQLQYHIIAPLDLVFIYSVPNWVNDFVKNVLHGNVTHSVAQYLNYSTLQNPENKVFLFLQDQNFVLITFKQSQLVNCMSNEYQQLNDVLYFLLAQHQKLNLIGHTKLDIFQTTQVVETASLEEKITQIKDLEKYQLTFFNAITYQKEILCASFEDH
jgi:hypothetical protein